MVGRRLGSLLGRPRWQQDGHEPDYRFSLANERTFLAWIRTALALMAGAVAVVQLVPHAHASAARRVLGVLLAILGLVIAASTYWRWSANERAMREQRPLPYSPLLQVAVAVLTVVGVVVVIVVAVG
jgi:putative membrane protein